MKDESKDHGAVDESSAEQQVCVSTSITFVVRKNWAYPPSASGSYRKEGGSEMKNEWISKVLKV